jgi:hypothetical protein
MSWVAGKGGLCGGCDQGQRSGGRNARGAVRVGVCWVAGEGCRRCRGCDEGQRSGGGDARGAVRVGVCWVACKSGAGSGRCHQRQSAVGGHTLDTFRVLVGWVASEVARCDRGRGSGSDESEVAICRDASHALGILVGRVASVVALFVERAGGHKAYCRKKCKGLTHLV